MNIPQEGKAAAQILIDAVSMAENGAGAPEAVNFAYDALHGGGLVPVSVSDAEDDLDVTVDLSTVLGAALVTMNKLVQDLADVRGVDADQIIIALREYIDA